MRLIIEINHRKHKDQNKISHKLIPIIGDFEDIKLEDIEPTTSTIEITREQSDSFKKRLCKRCNHKRGNHRVDLLENGTRCIGLDGEGCNISCMGFVE